MLEIYNEEVKDLLGKGAPAGKKHQISHDDKGTTSVSFVESVDCKRPEKVKELLAKATRMRSVGEHTRLHAPLFPPPSPPPPPNPQYVVRYTHFLSSHFVWNHSMICWQAPRISRRRRARPLAYTLWKSTALKNHWSKGTVCNRVKQRGAMLTTQSLQHLAGPPGAALMLLSVPHQNPPLCRAPSTDSRTSRV